MHHTHLMSVLHPPGNLLHQLGRQARRKHAPRDATRQRAAIRVFHRKKRRSAGDAHAVDRNDVGMLEPRRRLGVVAEPPQFIHRHIRMRDLDGDRPTELFFSGLVDNPSSAAAKLLENDISGDVRQCASHRNGMSAHDGIDLEDLP